MNQPFRWPLRLLGICVAALATSAAVLTCSSSVRSMEGFAEADREYKERESRARTHAIIGAAGVSIPVGRFLLVRKGKDICAIRFTDFARGAGRLMAFHTEYDWYYQGDGSFDFTKPNVESGHRQLSQKATWLPHPFEWSLFDVRAVQCGPFRLGWGYPTSVGFSTSNKKEDDVGNEFAPTKWKDVSEVNVKEPRFKWYRYDEMRQAIYIPIDQLW